MEIKKTNMPWLVCLFVRVFSLLFFFSRGFALEPTVPDNITVHLRHPTYSDGVLQTDQGGLVTTEDIRIQAKKIQYIRKEIEGQKVCTIHAEGQLLIEFGETILIGENLTYDFQKKTGVICHGKTAIEPWFFGGETIELHANGTYTIYNSFLTTSEDRQMEWNLSADEATLYPNRDLDVRCLQFQYFDVPLFWLPSFKVNLNYIQDFPIRYAIRFGGRQGPRVEFLYELFSWNRWKSFLRFDYRLTRGPGIGLENYYRSEDHREAFESINYIARDSSLDNPHEKYRFRFQGCYRNSLFDDRVSVRLTYDKLSDKDMATDYRDSGINYGYVGATQLLIRRQSTNWIANFLTSVRLNSFQTIKQDLPTFEMSWRPFQLGRTGIISNQFFKASFLDFTYAKHIHHFHDYHSSRIQWLQQFYRSFYLGPLIVTPECGGTAIYYGHLPEKNERWLMLGIFKLNARAPFYKAYDSCTHSVTPYISYQYNTFPSSSPSEHYIFDINDGLYRLNQLQFGIEQSLYSSSLDRFLYRPLKVNIYANAFIDTETIQPIIPKVYADLCIYPTDKLKYSLQSAWDFRYGELSYFNLRAEWTVSTNLAIAAEFRHRDAYDFRKADHTNFILDSYRSENELKHSALSDRRDTFLTHLFYRFHPLWALEFQLRHGWNRKHQPNYSELEVDLWGKPHRSWEMRISYQHRENDRHRFTVYFNMGLTQPDCWKWEHFTPEIIF